MGWGQQLSQHSPSVFQNIHFTSCQALLNNQLRLVIIASCKMTLCVIAQNFPFFNVYSWSLIIGSVFAFQYVHSNFPGHLLTDNYFSGPNHKWNSVHLFRLRISMEKCTYLNQGRQALYPYTWKYSRDLKLSSSKLWVYNSQLCLPCCKVPRRAPSFPLARFFFFNKADRTW